MDRSVQVRAGRERLNYSNWLLRLQKMQLIGLTLTRVEFGSYLHWINGIHMYSENQINQR